MSYLTETEIDQGLAELEEGFMVPNVMFFQADPDTGNYLEPNDPRHEDRGKGWYARLSAPGYPDCTEWFGPFDTKREGETHLVEIFWD